MSHTIAIIFDFDITLSPRFQQEVLFEAWGIAPQQFWGECDQIMARGYDMEHAYLRKLIDYGRKDPKYALTNSKLFEYGQSITLYDGLSRKEGRRSIFDDLQQIVEKEAYKELGITLEYYCISGGITEMIEGALESHGLSGLFREVFACRLDEDESGKLGYIKETVSHTIKTQKLFMIAKGVSPKRGDLPSKVNEPITPLRVPFHQMIFLGDGQTDIPAFSLINKNGGTSIAVYREIKRADGTIDEHATMKPYNEGYYLAIQSRRAEQLLPADYSAGKPLKMALMGYVEKIAKEISHTSRH